MHALFFALLLTTLAASANSLEHLSAPISKPARSNFTKASANGFTLSQDDGRMAFRPSFSRRRACDKVQFGIKKLKGKLGETVKVKQPTAVTFGHDGNLYVATREGYVHKIRYNPFTLVVQSMCHSEKFVDDRWKNAEGTIAPRAFLGIALDPRDILPRPYVSASTLGYHKNDIPISRSNLQAWSNGAIERFKPASAATQKVNPGQCLQHDKNIVQGLPVSNGAHSVNQIIFTQAGDLLVAVGSSTSMGLPNTNIGGVWDSYFSAAILLVKLSNPGFIGVIPHTTPNNPRTAKPKSGYKDVDIYASGFRNPFAMMLSRAGNVYVVDQGPNEGIGDAATNCSEYKETKVARGPAEANVTGGGAVFGLGKFSADRPDKVVLVKQGKFYGHPNLQRSVIKSVKECAYIDPLTGKTPRPGQLPAPTNYMPPLALVKSPVTGILEYGGNEFCGKFRGTLVLPNFLDSGTFALKLEGNGLPTRKPYNLTKQGGLSVVEDFTGSLIFPQYSSKSTDGFVVLKPQVTKRSVLYVSGAIPFRHGMKGGTKIRIAGSGFSSASTVKIGGKRCIPVTTTANIIVCKVPPRGANPPSVHISVKNGAKSVTLMNAVLYMNV